MGQRGKGSTVWVHGAVLALALWLAGATSAGSVTSAPPDGRRGEAGSGAVRRALAEPCAPIELRRRLANLDKDDLPQLFYYAAEGRLSCQLYQRSADVFLGVPFNIASYALLTRMVAQVVGLAPGEFILTLGDAHLYANHVEQARLQRARAPRPLPLLRLDPAVRALEDFRWEHVALEHYEPHPPIPAPVAV